MSDLLCEEALPTKKEFMKMMFVHLCADFPVALPFSEATFKKLVGAYTHTLFDKLREQDDRVLNLVSNTANEPSTVVIEAENSP